MASGLMTKQAAWLAGVLVMLVLGFTFAGEPRAQTQTMTVAVRNFEIIAVDGNHLILRDERGTSDYFVPADFVFTVDGKKMTVADLKAGMKGQATVTTTTTITPVTVTELRSGVVLGTGFNSVMVLDRTDGVRKKFTQDQVNARGLQIYKDGKVVPISQLNKGDEITATVVSQTPAGGGDGAGSGGHAGPGPPRPRQDGRARREVGAARCQDGMTPADAAPPATPPAPTQATAARARYRPNLPVWGPGGTC